MTFVSWQP